VRHANYNERHGIAATFMLEHIKHLKDILIVPRSIACAQEVLIIKRGRLRVDFRDRGRTCS
jgi:hypothetical protein